jgi:hypothetical protein
MLSFSAEEVLAILKEMSLSERKRLFKALDDKRGPAYQAGYAVFPIDIVEGILKASEMSALGTKHLIDLLNQTAGKLKRHKPSVESIRRNVEICNLWKNDRKKWSQGRLARTYHITARRIRAILKDEKKWRDLASKLPKLGTD